MQRSAKGQYYSVRGSDTAPRYIGILCEIQSVSSIIRTDGDLAIDDELSIFARIGSAHPAPSTNRILMVRKETGFERDDFSHEQCLVVRQDGKHYLFSGCAHHGILNIMDRYRTLYEGDPDYVISGFHMARKGEYSKEDMSFIRETAERLKEYDSLFYTCHCTGEIPYNEMKLIMGDKLQYIHSGDELDI